VIESAKSSTTQLHFIDLNGRRQRIAEIIEYRDGSEPNFSVGACPDASTRPAKPQRANWRKR